MEQSVLYSFFIFPQDLVPCCSCDRRWMYEEDCDIVEEAEAGDRDAQRTKKRLQKSRNIYFPFFGINFKVD